MTTVGVPLPPQGRYTLSGSVLHSCRQEASFPGYSSLRVCLRPRVRLTSKAQSPSGDRLECFQNGGHRASQPHAHGAHQFSSTLFLLSSLFLPRMLLTFSLSPLGPHYCLAWNTEKWPSEWASMGVLYSLGLFSPCFFTPRGRRNAA